MTRTILMAVGTAGCVIAGVLLVIGLSIRFELSDALYRTAADMPAREVVLVPGAGVYGDGRPNFGLADSVIE